MLLTRAEKDTGSIWMYCKTNLRDPLRRAAEMVWRANVSRRPRTWNSWGIIPGYFLFIIRQNILTVL